MGKKYKAIVEVDEEGGVIKNLMIKMGPPAGQDREPAKAPPAPWVADTPPLTPPGPEGWREVPKAYWDLKKGDWKAAQKLIGGPAFMVKKVNQRPDGTGGKWVVMPKESAPIAWEEYAYQYALPYEHDEMDMPKIRKELFSAGWKFNKENKIWYANTKRDDLAEYLVQDNTREKIEQVSYEDDLDIPF
jgi:hypothetical protein